MRQMMDIATDANGVPVIVNGDFVIAESTASHMRELLLNNKGEYKDNPTVCVGVPLYLDDDDNGDMLREISKQFAGDGMAVQEVSAGSDGSIKAIANY